MAPSKTSCIWLLAVFLLLCSALLFSQSRQSPPQTNFDEMLRRLMLEQAATQPEIHIAEKRAAEWADSEFLRKFNAHADAMNLVAHDKQSGMANLKHFEAAEKSWIKLTDDAGWLHKKK